MKDKSQLFWAHRALGSLAATASLMASTAAVGADSESTLSLPQLPEVIEVIRTHLPHISQEDLDRAALQGILTEFQSQLEIVATPTSTTPESTPEPAGAALTRYFDSSIGYLAVPVIDESAVDSIDTAYKRLDSEQIIDGLILDLRHVSGNDYASLPAITGLFASEAKPLLDWGEGIKNVAPQSSQIDAPVVALIDETTQGAGEALAAIIREAKLGILVGRRTAGEARAFENVPLKSGQTLRLATGNIQLVGKPPLSKEGVQPDITVERENTSETADIPETKETAEALLDSPARVPANDPILSRGHELLKSLRIVQRRNRS